MYIDIKKYIKITPKKLSYHDTYIFFENLYELTKSGIPMIKSFDVINMNNKNMLEQIKNNLNNGSSLSSALEQTQLFTPTTISIIQSGEISGNLELCFEKLYKYNEKMNETKKSVQSSLFYPCILVVSIVFLLAFINFYFIPQIMNMYDYDTHNLNNIAKIFISFSKFSNKYKTETLVFFSSTILMLSFLLNDLYKQKDDIPILLRIPIVSKITKNYIISNIIWTYFLMMSSGIDIVKSTNIIANATKNKIAKSKLNIIMQTISEGNSISNALDKADIKEKNILYFVNIGEESGTLDNSLKILSQMYTKNLNSDIKYITQIIQPFLIIIITCIVGILITGIVLPLLDYSRFM